MKARLEMVGLINYVGHSINRLRVTEMVARRPLPRYRVVCEICGAVGVESQDRLSTASARCRAGGCGKLKTSRYHDTPAITVSAPNTIPPPEQLIDGWDLVSKQPRKWSQRELDQLSSEDYRRALRLYKASLDLPNIGPGSLSARRNA